MSGMRLNKLIDEARMAAAGFLASRIPSSQHIQSNKVVLCAYHGAGYGCNPKYVAEALLRLAERPLDLVWLGRSYDPAVPSAIRQVRWGSVEAAKEWACATVWVDNARTRRYVRKKPGQFYVQTWHGCLSPKPLEADIEHMLSSTYIKGAKQDSKDADLFVCNNDFFEGVIRRSFYYDGPILRCGLPRNAALILPKADAQERVRAQLGVPDLTRLCLYAPTFRDDGNLDAYTFDFERCCQTLQQRFGAPFAFALRLHPNDAARSQHVAQAGIIDASSYGDPMELLLASDVLISDYSSMIEDFALLGRPGYQFIPDADSFASTRGLYYDLESRPYPAARTEEELFDVILTTSDDLFRTKREAFFSQIGLDDDGKGDEAVARVILDVLRQRESN